MIPASICLISIIFYSTENVDFYANESNSTDQRGRRSSEKRWKALRNCLLQKQSHFLEKQSVNLSWYTIEKAF